MKKVVKNFALAALCATALTTVSQTANALVFDIVNGASVTSFTYGAPIGDNNVINAPGAPVTGSTVFDSSNPTNSTFWQGTASGGPSAFVSVTGLAPNTGYNIAWTYIGSESGNTIQFSVPNAGNVAVNGAITTNEDNRNSSCVCQPGSVQVAPTVGMGSTSYFQSVGNIPAFTLLDLETGANVTNGGPNAAPGTGIANLIFSYATFDGQNYHLTDTPTAFLVFGFNDNGGLDDNHDDFMGLLTLTPGGRETTTPIPGALPLFGSVLGGGLLLRRLRKRKKTVKTA